MSVGERFSEAEKELVMRFRQQQRKALDTGVTGGEGPKCLYCGYPIWHGNCSRTPCPRREDNMLDGRTFP
jgi:hypothetical protein